MSDDPIQDLLTRLGLPDDAYDTISEVVDQYRPTMAPSSLGSKSRASRKTLLESLKAGSGNPVRVGAQSFSGVTWLPELLQALDEKVINLRETVSESYLTRRYQDMGPIAAGGMGEVRRVFDRDINRVVALKVIRTELMNDVDTMSRFVAEAQVTGQLQHRGIVPVHDIGLLKDGRLFFTMREIQGRELGDIIMEVHVEKQPGRWVVSESGWTFRRLIDVFHKVCEAVAFAHSRGVLHRDLKPSNVLVGAYGEVHVVDWGLARILGIPEEPVDEATDDPPSVITHRAQDNRPGTMTGQIAGTPWYMPPEQAAGKHELLGPYSDVFALGAMLFEVLSGRPPFRGRDPHEVLARVIAGDISELPEGPEYPEPLRKFCLKALSHDPYDRYPTAQEFTDDLAAWLDGAKRREEALSQLRRAQEKRQNIKRLHARAEALRDEATRILSEVDPADPVEMKRLGWERQAEAQRLEHGAELIEAVVTQLARAALGRAPELEEAHQFLADHYKALHDQAEERTEEVSAQRYRALLKSHDNGRYEAYLKGDGAFSLVTDPSGAEVTIHRYDVHTRRLVATPVGLPLITPIREHGLPMGSYLLAIRHPHRATVRYPVHIRREEHWDGVPPGESEPQPIYLPQVEELGKAEVYVPAGWAMVGGDAAAPNAQARDRVWIDGFAIRRSPVTNAEYIDFLNDLLKQFRERDANLFAPRARGSVVGELGPVLYGRDRHDQFSLAAGEEGTHWKADWPVMMVDWHCAYQFGLWQTVMTGDRWRLPHELEWEKAARGVDGRAYPWGAHTDPTWCCMQESKSGRGNPVSISRFPEDVSPYGIFGLAGNIRDWCGNPYHIDGSDVTDGRLRRTHHGAQQETVYRSVRGGAWNTGADECRSAARHGVLEGERSRDIGFRIARNVGPHRPRATGTPVPPRVRKP